MQLNEVKKTLYKEAPTAILHEVRKDGILYTTGFGNSTLTFLVPLDEIGEVIWRQNMEAKYLIRYLIHD